MSDCRMDNRTGAILPVQSMTTKAPISRHQDLMEIIHKNFHNLPSILDMRLHEWVQQLTSSKGGLFPNGVSPKQMETVAQAQWNAAVRVGRRVRPHWRGSNHLSALLSNEVRAGRLMRLQKACYVGREDIRQPISAGTNNEVGSGQKSFRYCAICVNIINPAVSVPLCCKSCGIYMHAECGYNQRRVPMKLLGGSSEWLENWHCLNCKKCNVCGSADKKKGLLCSTCDSMEHVGCQRAIDSTPLRYWICSLCAKKSAFVAPIAERGTPSGSTCTVAYSDSVQLAKIPTPNDVAGNCPPMEYTGHSAQSYYQESSNHIHQTTVINADGASSYHSPTPILAKGGPTRQAGGEETNGRGKQVIEETRRAKVPCEKRAASASPMQSFDTTSVKTWSTSQVAQYFKQLGHPDSARAFAKEDVDGPALLLMQRADVLHRLGVRIGPALKTYKVVRRLQKHHDDGTKTPVIVE